MCWVISTGKRSITGPSSVTSVISACGPPVEEPIRSTRGACVLNGAAHQLRLRRPARRRAAACARPSVGASGGRRGDGVRRGAADLGAEMADLLDQVVVEGFGGGGFAGAFRLRNVVGRAERQRLEADLRVAAGQRRGHDDDEVALLRQQLRQRGNAVELRHFDIEHGNVGIDALDLVDGVKAGAQRGCDHHVRLGCDPARDQSADDDEVVDHHHPQRLLPRRGRGRGTCQRNTHYFTRYGSSGTMKQ